MWKIWQSSKKYKNDRYGQFLSHVGYYIARGWLPWNCLELFAYHKKISIPYLKDE
jgi:hypothetical protein